ncbi:MAG TPA: TldD/PmbA family protein [Candidatus Limnocylindrales bacterium]|nr:TldD/PmbA family protein [Candidatus Limnocylindrales bacterium]
MSGRATATGPRREAGEAWLALAERVVAEAERAGATQAETLVVAEDAALTRFANSEIHQNVAETNVRIGLRFVLGKRIGVASTDRTDAEGVGRLVERAARVAALAAEVPDFVSLPGPGPIPRVEGAYAATTADASPELRADAARAVIAAADETGAAAYGSFSTTTETVAVANSLGVRVHEARTSSQLVVVAMASDGGSGYAEALAVDAASIDPQRLGREAAEKARASRHPVALEPGEYPVVLEEYAVGDLVDMLGYLGFGALAVQERRSFMEPGKRVGSELVTIRDDATDPAGLPAAFDYEGVGKQPVTLIERGVCRDVVYDSATAAREGKRSTGHALPAPNPWGPFPLNLLMEPGDTPRDELVGGLERGLLVTRFHYTNPVHPKLAIVTGMTRDGTFLVEGGRVVGPVRNLRYTQSYLEALAGVEAVGRERRCVRGLGSTVVPAVRIASWTFTGATEE